MKTKPIDFTETEDIEAELLLQAIFLKYGFDFRNYSRAHIKRRIKHRQELDGFRTISELQEKILHDLTYFESFLGEFSINVTEMFRDPIFYKAIRKLVVPILKTYPFIKIWHAGCSTGEEVYSMAIILKEEGLLNKTQLYATDFNNDALNKAKKGIYSIENIKVYTSNYQGSGGKESFANYYVSDDSNVILSNELKEKIVFSEHNLVADSVFGEMNMIISRNVLIYFNRELQNRVIELFSKSLVPGGFLGLGSKESLSNIDSRNAYDLFAANEKIYRLKL